MLAQNFQQMSVLNAQTQQKKSGYLGSTNEFLRTPMSDFVEMTRKLEDIFLKKTAWYA